MTQSIKLGPDGAITTAASVVGPIDITGYSNINVLHYGTYAGVTINFEASQDGITWTGLNGAAVGASAIGTLTTPASNVTNAFDFATSGFSQFRVRASAWTSGTMSIQISGSFSNYDPAPNVTVGNTPSVILTPSASGGGVTLNNHLVSAATTNATSVKVTAGSIASATLVNTSAAAKYVKFFNKASAPTVGTDVPTLTVLIPPTATLVWEPANYTRFTTGIAYCITGAGADLDTTVVAAGDVIVSIYYV